MSSDDLLRLRSSALQACLALLDQRITTARTAMDQAQESANSGEKSSAGDKYETARAMGQLDRDMNARQLEQALNDKKQIENLSVNGISERIQTGSLFVLEDQIFFVAVGLGNIQVSGHRITAISPRSPIGQQALGKTTNDSLTMNGETRRITQVC